MLEHLPLLLDFFRASVPLIAAGVAAYVAHKFGAIQAEISRQQAATAAASAKIAREKLKLDLFERRLQIYQVTSDFISKALHHGDTSSEDEMEFLSGVQGARWLFGEDIVEYINITLWAMLADFHRINMELKSPMNDDDRRKLAAERHNIFKAINKQRIEIDKIFAPYLKLES